MRDFARAVWTIFRREIKAQYSSPMAYIFIIVFLVVGTGLFLFFPPFFAFPRAEMTSFFGWLVPVLCVFAPAATMRTWAEDRKENTIELLLTFPMSAPALVLGKFLAALAFYLAALASTVMIPLMLAWLGEPDWGRIASGYFGAFLVGALFLAVGMFMSGFCRDQVTAFVLSFLACGTASLFGWNVFAGILEGTLGWLGAFLKAVLGMTAHYVPFTRGIVEVADILYFLVWTGLILFLNGVYLEGRGRPLVNLKYAATVALSLLVGTLFNLTVAERSIARFDLTEDKIYTVSEASKEILKGLKVPVQVKLYITPASKMPAELKTLERDITDKLREMSVASGGMLKWKVIHMEAANVLRDAFSAGEEKKDKERSLEERLIDKGVKPFSVSALREDQTTTQLIYSSIGVAYKEKEEEIIPQVMPSTLPELEYRLISVIFKLTRDKQPTVALVAPYQDIQIPPHLMQLYLQMGQMPPRRDDPYVLLQKVLEYEKFNVRRVRLEKDDPLPKEYDALVVVDPRNLDERQKWEINRALVQGKPTFIAAQMYRWNYSIYRDSISVSKEEVNPGVNDFLSPSGLGISRDILMDANHEPLTITSGNPLERLLGGGTPVDLPTHIVVNPASMNPDISITSRIGRIFYLWGSHIELDEEKLSENKLQYTTLFSTSDGAWTLPADQPLTQASIQPPPRTARYPLAVMVKGQFVDAYAGKERPEWPEKPPRPGAPPPSGEEEEPAGPLEPAPGKLVLVGCAECFRRNFLTQGNLDFFMNCIDALTLGEELIHIRAKKPIDRTIDRPRSAFTRAFWKYGAHGLVVLLIVAAGITRAVLVRRSRERYRASLRAGG